MKRDDLSMSYIHMIRIIILIFCLILNYKFVLASEISPLPTAKVIVKARTIFKAKLDSKKIEYIEKFDDKYVDRKIVYYSISDIKVIRGDNCFYPEQEFYYLAPFPEFKRGKNNERIKFNVSQQIDGTGKEFNIKEGQEYIFFLKHPLSKKNQIIRIEENIVEKLNAITSIIDLEKLPTENNNLFKKVEISEKDILLTFFQKGLNFTLF